MAQESPYCMVWIREYQMCGLLHNVTEMSTITFKHCPTNGIKVKNPIQVFTPMDFYSSMANDRSLRCFGLEKELAV